jgi:hypothetical protein
VILRQTRVPGHLSEILDQILFAVSEYQSQLPLEPDDWAPLTLDPTW